MNTGVGCDTPRYVRLVELRNQTGNSLNVTSFYRSGQSSVQNSGDELIHIESEIQHETYSEVDPVEKIIIELNGESSEHTFQPIGVEVITFDVKLISDKLNVERILEA